MSLPDAREELGAGDRASIFGSQVLWVSVGQCTGPTETPAGELVLDNVVHFRLDKFALDDSTKGALRSVRAILDRTEGDCVLFHLFDSAIFMRINGVMRAFAYRGQVGFWDVHDVAESLGPDVELVILESPLNADDGDDADGGDDDGWDEHEGL